MVLESAAGSAARLSVFKTFHKVHQVVSELKMGVRCASRALILRPARKLRLMAGLCRGVCCLILCF
jgi:hypothetical protein